MIRILFGILTSSLYLSDKSAVLWLPPPFLAAAAAVSSSMPDISAVASSSIITRVVRTKYGDISGTIVTPNGRYLDAIEVYRGIPYAAPPVRNLRFMPPVSGAQWTGVLMADKFAPVCPQHLPDIADEADAIKRMPKGRYHFLKRILPYLQNQSEDCLYLNIYAPTQDGDEMKKYPVMVFIHGESYEWNSGNPYDGTVLASYGGLVVVTINYRLGVLGFLNTNTDANQKSPSNYGLMDQIAALHWLQENVAFFGGDPTNVTLVGHSTGAACVNFLMSSMAVPEGLLFHRVILMSGSSLSPWALVKEPSTYAQQIASSVKCSFQQPHQSLLKCLRDRPVEMLVNASVHVARSEFDIAFGPNIDGVIIDIIPSEMLPTNTTRLRPSFITVEAENSGDSAGSTDSNNNSKLRPFNDITVSEYASTILNNRATKERLISKFSRYDMMAGVVSAESFFTFTNDDVQYGIEPDRRSKLLKTFVRHTYRYHLSEILATIVNEYTEWERPTQHPVNIRDETLEALSDAQYVAPVTQTVDLHSSAKRNNSYFYVFEYQTKYSHYQQRQGCVHGEELPYLFGAPLVNSLQHFAQNYTKAEITLSEAFMSYVGNFIKTGNPNDAGKNDAHRQNDFVDKNRLKNIQWAPYETNSKKYLSMDTKLKLQSHYRAHKLSIWMYLIPELHKSGTDDLPLSHHQFPPHEVVFSHPSVPENVANVSSIMFKGSSEGHPFNSSFDLPVVVIASSSSSSDGNGGISGTQNDETIMRDERLVAKDTAHAVSPSQQQHQQSLSNYSLALIVIITIGCSLLTFNVLVFIFVYRKKVDTRVNSSDRNSSGSTRSLSSNDSIVVGFERACSSPQMPSATSKKLIIENGIPANCSRTTVNDDDMAERIDYMNADAKVNQRVVDQSTMFMMETINRAGHQNDMTNSKFHCHTMNNSDELKQSYWSNGKLVEDIDLYSTNTSPCFDTDITSRPLKSILKH